MIDKQELSSKLEDLFPSAFHKLGSLLKKIENKNENRNSNTQLDQSKIGRPGTPKVQMHQPTSSNIHLNPFDIVDESNRNIQRSQGNSVGLNLRKEDDAILSSVLGFKKKKSLGSAKNTPIEDNINLNQEKDKTLQERVTPRSIILQVN